MRIHGSRNQSRRHKRGNRSCRARKGDMHKLQRQWDAQGAQSLNAPAEGELEVLLPGFASGSPSAAAAAQDPPEDRD